METFTLLNKPINLMQLLKAANVAESGGMAKILIQDELVKVNGEIEHRLRRKMSPGDIIVIDDEITIKCISQE